METKRFNSDPADGHSRVLDAGGIALRVREAIRSANVPQSEIAAYLGVSRSTIERRLKGERMFTANEIALIAKRLKVPVGDLLEHAA